MDAVSSVKEGIRRIQNDSSPRLTLCDDRLEDGDWKAILDVTLKRRYPSHLIVASRLADECLWAEALNHGCYDVLAKPYDASEVIRVVSTAWWRRSLGREATQARRFQLEKTTTRGNVLACARYTGRITAAVASTKPG
jgi:DNA-binding NtrC family response regulator